MVVDQYPGPQAMFQDKMHRWGLEAETAEAMSELRMWAMSQLRTPEHRDALQGLLAGDPILLPSTDFGQPLLTVYEDEKKAK